MCTHIHTYTHIHTHNSRNTKQLFLYMKQNYYEIIFVRFVQCRVFERTKRQIV